jgi:hypothetical protein
MGLQTKVAVDFDSGRAGQKALAYFESIAPPSDVNRDGGNLAATWQNAADALVESVVEEFLASDTILEVHLLKEE